MRQLRVAQAMTLRRGDVALAFYPFVSAVGGSHRPVLNLQSDTYNRRHRNTIVAQITTNLSRANDPAHLLIDLLSTDGQQSGLLHDSVVSRLNPATLIDNRVNKAVSHLPDKS